MQQRTLCKGELIELVFAFIIKLSVKRDFGQVEGGDAFLDGEKILIQKFWKFVHFLLRPRNALLKSGFMC